MQSQSKQSVSVLFVLHIGRITESCSRAFQGQRTPQDDRIIDNHRGRGQACEQPTKFQELLSVLCIPKVRAIQESFGCGR